MKHSRAIVPSVMLTLVLCLLTPELRAADTGRDLFQARCAECHGKNGEGRSKIKSANLKSDRVKEMSDDDLKAIVTQRANGEMEKRSSHTRLKQRLNADQVDAVIAYIRELQGK